MSAAASLNGKRVLVVEDNDFIARLLCDVMRRAGAVPVGPAAATGEAIELAMHEDLDGALLDVQLQDGDAVEVAQYLRAQHIPVLLVTAHDRDSLNPDLRDFRYLTKLTLLSDLLEEAAAAFAVERQPPE